MDIMEKCEGCLRNFKNASFLLKFIALLLNIVNVILWRVPEEGSTGAMEVWEECVFAHSVPAYMVVLSGMVVIYSLGEQPDKWFHRLFFVPGVVLFATTATNTLLNYLEYPSMGTVSVVMSVLCFLIAFVMVLDLLLHENLFGF
uniref:Uncharacterized protein n=1 Tax=Cuerna arida TaxID=1464854 RepID=A0A1B6GF62_9HEMI